MKMGIQVMQVRDERAIELAQAADAAGFDALWLAGGGDNYIKAALMLHATKHITIGTSIIGALLMSPVAHANMANYLQLISGNRFILGFGSQTKGQLRLDLGRDVDKIAKRAKEIIEVTRGILSGQGFEYQGEFEQFTGGARRIRGGTVPPAIYHSGVGPINLLYAGMVTDGFLAHPIFTRKYYQDVVWPRIDEGLRRAGKTRADFEMVAMPMTLIAEDESEMPELISAAKRNIAFYFTTRAYGDFQDFNGWSKQREAIWEVAARVGRDARRFDYNALEACVTDDMVDELCLVGTAEQVRTKAMARFGDIADQIDFYPMHDGSQPPDHAQAHEFMHSMRFVKALEGFNK